MKNQRKKDRRWTPLKKYINMAITKTPFIYEIKTAMDFSVTDTAIGLFDWFKFEDVYNQFFNAKYSQLSKDMSVMGSKQTASTKMIFGWCFLIVFLVILFGPLFLFSSFNPISQPNKVKNMILSLGVKINDAQFELFSNTHPKVNRNITESEFLTYFG